MVLFCFSTLFLKISNENDRRRQHLEEIKAKDPKKYAQIVRELQEASSKGEFAAKLPGGGVLGKKKDEAAEGMEIVPSPGFVIKTYDLATGEKVFINICTSENLEKPAMKKKLDENGVEQEGMNIPLSLGDKRDCTDKKKRPCTVYDVVVNPEVVAESKADTSGTHRHFLCELAMNYLRQKFRRNLDPKYKLPRLHYQDLTVDGKCHPQWIKKAVAPKIQEVDSSTKKKENNSKSIRKVEKIVQKPKGTMRMRAYALLKGEKIDEESKKVEIIRSSGNLLEDWPLVTTDMQQLPSAIRLEIAVENLKSIDGVLIEMSSNFLSISAPDFHKFETLLPYTVLRSRDTSARLDRNLQILTIDALIDPSDSSMSSLNDTTPDAGSRPWLLARALREGAPKEDESSVKKVKDIKSNNNNFEFPEDRFLKQDALSQHYIQQKEEARRTKAKRAAEERKKREKNPNVEYIDDLTEWAKKQDTKKNVAVGNNNNNNNNKVVVEEKKVEEEEKVKEEEKQVKTRIIPEVTGLSIPSSTAVDSEAATTLKASHDLIFDLLE
jgi:hypothetical protein